MKSSDESSGVASKGYKFGTFKGVYTPSILTILGVVMYLRFGWVLGNVGLPGMLLIITIGNAITFFTGLSLSALATNMRVEGGGAYYIISRSLGIEAGAAVGLPLFFAQALGISFYIAGFAESVVAIFPQFNAMYIGIVTLVLLTTLAYNSADMALKSQFVIMIIIFVSLISFFSGGAPAMEMPDVSSLPPVEPFWVVFAVFFPAVTGIEAGIAMSGDLKDPARSLPKGTVGAILTGYAVYMAIPIFLSYVIADTSVLRADSMTMIMAHVAKWGKVIILGVWAASLSSAMGSLLGAPRTLQALAKDRVVPRIFGRGFGKGNDPRIATATAFLVGLAGIMLGDLNVIAPVLTMFFLTSYGLLNVSAGLEELTGSPSWRPKFRIPWYISLAGAFGCFASMFMINAGATFIAAFVAAGVYYIMERRSLTARWGDMRSGLLMLIARNSIYALTKRPTDERTWKPNILVLSGSPSKRWYLIELAGAISQDRGFLTVATIVPGDTEQERLESMEKAVSEYLCKRDLPAVVKIYPADTSIEGVEMLTKTYGYGPITPNTILLGITEDPDNYLRFSKQLKMMNARRQNVVLVREGDEDHVETEGKRIDVWWYGTQQNLGLMLAFVYMLKRSRSWRHADLVLKTIVAKPEDRWEVQQRLEKFIENVRVDARAEVIAGSGDDIFENIRRLSEGADLVFMGMRKPGAEESDEDYCTYYRELISKTNGLPHVALVLAAEEMNHYSIFQAE